MKKLLLIVLALFFLGSGQLMAHEWTHTRREAEHVITICPNDTHHGREEPRPRPPLAYIERTHTGPFRNATARARR